MPRRLVAAMGGARGRGGSVDRAAAPTPSAGVTAVAVTDDETASNFAAEVARATRALNMIGRGGGTKHERERGRLRRGACATKPGAAGERLRVRRVALVGYGARPLPRRPAGLVLASHRRRRRSSRATADKPPPSAHAHGGRPPPLRGAACVLSPPPQRVRQHKEQPARPPDAHPRGARATKPRQPRRRTGRAAHRPRLTARGSPPPLRPVAGGPDTAPPPPFNHVARPAQEPTRGCGATAPPCGRAGGTAVPRAAPCTAAARGSPCRCAARRRPWSPRAGPPSTLGDHHLAVAADLGDGPGGRADAHRRCRRRPVSPPSTPPPSAPRPTRSRRSPSTCRGRRSRLWSARGRDLERPAVLFFRAASPWRPWCSCLHGGGGRCRHLFSKWRTWTQNLIVCYTVSSPTSLSPSSRLVKTPTKRTCGFSCDFHSSIAAGRDTICDRITVEDAIGTTLVHSVNPSNSWLSINLSTGTRDENQALSVQSPLKALHRACPIHVDSFFHAKRMEGLSDSLAIAHLLRHLTPQVELRHRGGSNAHPE